MNCPSLPGSLAAASVAATVTSAVSLSNIMTDDTFAVLTVMSVSSVPVRVNVTDSTFSKIESSSTLMSIVAVVEPAKTVTVPDRATKSVPAVAVPLIA